MNRTPLTSTWRSSSAALLLSVTVALAGCGSDDTSDASQEDLSSGERADLVMAAREAAADELYYEVEEVQPAEVTVVDDCAVVLVETPGVTERSTGSAVMRRDGSSWAMVDMVTGDVALRIDPDSDSCWR